MSEQNLYQAPQSDISSAHDESVQPAIFTIRGRIGRMRYFSYAMIYSLVFYVALVLFIILAVAADSANSVFFTIGLAVSFAIFMWSCLMLMRRRLNDLGHSGWFALLSLVPLVNFLLGLYLLFAPGDRHSNDFGGPPTHNHPALWLWLIGPFLAGILGAVSIPAYNDYVQRAESQLQSY